MNQNTGNLMNDYFILIHAKT